MIISGGVDVCPQEAENVLMCDPAVMDAAVFGIPHDDLGEQVHAVVQLTTYPETDEQEKAERVRLMALSREKLADVTCPRSLDFREELPRRDTGKLYERLPVDEHQVTAAAQAAGCPYTGSLAGGGHRAAGRPGGPRGRPHAWRGARFVARRAEAKFCRTAVRPAVRWTP